MLSFDFKNQLLGDWSTAKFHLIRTLEDLFAGLRTPSAFLDTITTDATTGLTSVALIDEVNRAVAAAVAAQALLCCRPDVKRIAGLAISAAATPASGFADFGMQGVLTSVNYNNTTPDVKSWWAEYRAPAGAGNVANLSWGTPAITWCLSEHLPTIRWHIKTGTDITSCRIWCGIMDTIPSPGSDTQAGQDGILFRYSTVAGDAGWVGFASKSLGGNAYSTTGVVAAINANTVYDLCIRVVSVTSAALAEVAFSVNGGPEALLHTNVPIIAQYVGFGMSPVLEIETRVAATRSVFVSRAYFEAN